MMPIVYRFSLSVIFCLALAACGGGGGGGGSDAAPIGIAPPPQISVAPPPPPPPVVTPPLVTTVPVIVQGNLQYEKVGSNTNGSLNYASITQLPIRGATVELIFGNAVLATTQASATGQFVFTAAPGSTTLSIKVRAELKQTTGAAQWDVTVRDNTNGDALYVLASTAFNSGAGITQNLVAGSGWQGISYANTARFAGPFAILDTFYASMQKVLQGNPNTVFPVLQSFWSINNNTASSDTNAGLALGNIGSSFFIDSPSRKLYILGKQNDDTDEYDASVVAHEWGHYYQSAFSRDESMGGSHGGSDDRLDRRIAFSEGWGNAWSGIALGNNRYTDSSGARQGAGFGFALNSGHTGATPKGWFREQSILYILWDLNRQIGFSPINAALTSTAFKNGVPLSDIHSFSAAFRSTATASQTAVLNALLTSESISSTSDQFGSTETNNGGVALSLPYYKQITALGSPVTLEAGQTVCVTATSGGTSAGGNKLGQFAYARFTTPSAGNRSFAITTTTPGVDTDFEVYTGSNLVLNANRLETPSENGSVNLAAGEHVLVVYDFNKAAGAPCFTISIQ